MPRDELQSADRPFGDRPVVDIDHQSKDYFADRHGAWADLRRRCPVAHSEHHGGFWAVASYDAGNVLLAARGQHVAVAELGWEDGATTILARASHDGDARIESSRRVSESGR